MRHFAPGASFWVLGSLVLAGCGTGKSAAAPAHTPLPGTETAPEAAAPSAILQVAKPPEAARIAEPVDFRELHALLPENVPGMERVDVKGERQVQFGMSVAKALATYRAQSDAAETPRTVLLKLSDFGTIRNLPVWRHWSIGDVLEEGEAGHRKTIQVGKYKALEEYKKSGRRGVLRLIVANRFQVELEGSGSTLEEMKTVLFLVDLEKLEALGERGLAMETGK